MGSTCLFTRQRALKMRYFYWLRVKNSNHLHTELSLGYLEDGHFLPVKFFPEYYFYKLCFELLQNVTWTDE